MNGMINIENELVNIGFTKYSAWLFRFWNKERFEEAAQELCISLQEARLHFVPVDHPAIEDGIPPMEIDGMRYVAPIYWEKAGREDGYVYMGKGNVQGVR